MSVQQTGGPPAPETVPAWQVPEAKEATLRLPLGATLRVTERSCNQQWYRRSIYVDDRVVADSLAEACATAPAAFAKLLRTVADELEKYA